MAVLSKDELKALFQTKDRPTGEDFAALIDAMLHADFSNWPDILPAASAKNLTEIQSQTTVNAWEDVSAVPGYVDTDELAFSGNQEAIFIVGRRVRLTLGSGYVFTEVLSASYSSGSNSTTLMLADAVADNTITDIDVSIFLPVDEGGAVGLGTLGGTAFAATLLDDADAAEARATLEVLAASTALAGLIEIATTTEVYDGEDGVRAVTPFSLRTRLRGTILPYAGNGIPSWGLDCNGQNVSRTTYDALFAVIGTVWGAGNGSTTFTLPDLRRRAIVGVGGTGSGVLGNGIGSVGGAESMSVQHQHDGSVSGTTSFQTQTASISGPVGTAFPPPHDHTFSDTFTTGNMSANATISIMQPSAVVRFLIVH